MKRLFLKLSVWNYFKRNKKKENNSDVLEQSDPSSHLKPNLSNEPKVVLTSKDDAEFSTLSSRFSKAGSQSYGKVILTFLENEPRAKNGFTAVELHNWMGGNLAMPSISKTLYRMKICGLVTSEVKNDDGRIRIWKLVSKK